MVLTTDTKTTSATASQCELPLAVQPPGRIEALAAKTGLTEEQAAAAFALGSVAVTAGAGTGKTHMLAERYLFHLTERGLSPLEVVAVSFTRKAAAELRSRIRSKIAATLGPDSEELAELEAAPISTFHSLAGRICREHPDAAEIPPNFQMMDELEGALWRQEQLDRAFHRLPSQVPELCEKIPYSKVRGIFEVLLADPLEAQAALGRSRQDWLPALEQVRRRTLEDLLGNPQWQMAREVVMGNYGGSKDKLEAIRAGVAEALDDLEAGDDWEAIADAVTVISQAKINVGSVKNWHNDKELLKEVKWGISTLRDQVKAVQKLGTLTLNPNEHDDELEALLPLLKQGFEWVNQCFEVAKKRSRILDFSDLEVYALRALEKREVREYYAERWHGFLVDEFQDTNPTQGLILERLVGDRLSAAESPNPAWLTIVGDDKQAIYGFRGGDIEVFQAWRDRIAQVGGDRVSLTRSFRTHGPLTTQINRIFKPILGELHQDLDGVREA
ncbi:MAG: UvrD-helicase domain-containing protein, partial [Cyanobacteria bacterium P01_D01_bin.73]